MRQAMLSNSSSCILAAPAAQTLMSKLCVHHGDTALLSVA